MSIKAKLCIGYCSWEFLFSSSPNWNPNWYTCYTRCIHDPRLLIFIKCKTPTLIYMYSFKIIRTCMLHSLWHLLFRTVHSINVKCFSYFHFNRFTPYFDPTSRHLLRHCNREGRSRLHTEAARNLECFLSLSLSSNFQYVSVLV